MSLVSFCFCSGVILLRFVLFHSFVLFRFISMVKTAAPRCGSALHILLVREFCALVADRLQHPLVFVSAVVESRVAACICGKNFRPDDDDKWILFTERQRANDRWIQAQAYRMVQNFVYFNAGHTENNFLITVGNQRQRSAVEMAGDAMVTEDLNPNERWTDLYRLLDRQGRICAR